jgi:glyoxylase-like metal-dependent hydrolase (beta-lactamase superfamily II)
MLAQDAEPAQLAEALKLAGQQQDRVFPPLNLTLIRRGADLILVDSGSESRFMDSAGRLPEQMEAAGIATAEVTKLVFTHGHPDHLWGIVDDFDELRFPNAEYFMSADEHAFWTGNDVLSKLPAERHGFATGAQRSLAAIKPKLHLTRPGEEVAPGVGVFDTAGHTQGHVSIELHSQGETIMVLGDALTHPVISFAHPDWRPASDHEPERAVATRRKLLDRLAGEKLPFIAYHLPFPGLGLVERRGLAFAFVPIAQRGG